MSIDGTDRRPPDRYIDIAPHIMQAASVHSKSLALSVHVCDVTISTNSRPSLSFGRR